MMTNNNLFFLCSLIEFIGRQQKLSRDKVVLLLGHEAVKHIYEFADVLHCEPISKVADEYINLCRIETGAFDNVSACNNISSNNGTGAAKGAVKEEQAADIDMGSLFMSALRTELLQMDVMSMTPIEALNALYKLQQEAKKESGVV